MKSLSFIFLVVFIFDSSGFAKTGIGKTSLGSATQKSQKRVSTLAKPKTPADKLVQDQKKKKSPLHRAQIVAKSERRPPQRGVVQSTQSNRPGSTHYARRVAQQISQKDFLNSSRTSSKESSRQVARASSPRSRQIKLANAKSPAKGHSTKIALQKVKNQGRVPASETPNSDAVKFFTKHSQKKVSNGAQKRAENGAEKESLKNAQKGSQKNEQKMAQKKLRAKNQHNGQTAIRHGNKSSSNALLKFINDDKAEPVATSDEKKSPLTKRTKKLMFSDCVVVK